MVEDLSIARSDVTKLFSHYICTRKSYYSKKSKFHADGFAFSPVETAFELNLACFAKRQAEINSFFSDF